MNSLKITWAIITPSKRIATKKDLKVIKKVISNACTMGYPAHTIAAFFPSIEKAKEAVLKISGLSKPYDVLFITDKQFGKTENLKFHEVATNMQIQSMIEIR